MIFNLSDYKPIKKKQIHDNSDPSNLVSSTQMLNFQSNYN